MWKRIVQFSVWIRKPDFHNIVGTHQISPNTVKNHENFTIAACGEVASPYTGFWDLTKSIHIPLDKGKKIFGISYPFKSSRRNFFV